MKTTTTLFVALLSAVSVHAQAGLNQFPCATQCITNLIQDPTCNKGSGAPAIDCVCTSQNLIDTVSCCIYKNCDKASQTGALNLAKGVCANVQGQVLPQSAGCSGSASTAAATTATASSGASAGTGSSASMSMTGAAAMTTGPAAAASSVASSAGNQASGAAVGGAAGVSPSNTPDAANVNGVAAGGVLAGAVGVAALLL